MNYSSLKSKFKAHFSSELNNCPELKSLLSEILDIGGAYIVGGYLRDFMKSKKSRDLDILVEVDFYKLKELVNEYNCSFSVNRHNGIKLQFKNINVDMWSIENNWAFKCQVVKLNEKDKLNSIAKGCFYNYDSLVMNISSYNINLKNYNNYLKNNKLDILLKSSVYKNLNPTTEANILRAFYIKKTEDVQFSSNTKKYLIDKIGQLKDKGIEPVKALERTKKKYEKYQNVLSSEDILNMINELYSANRFDNQIHLHF
ncbi:hypothetical protein AB9P05_24565 [Roseivirga sp. BDSF3-8]|uniref:hypothetical protein n=1 Tax=Roseivirga sp. BDSF3-8 TaxID=3241598 RepID=UPI0035325C0E